MNRRQAKKIYLGTQERVREYERAMLALLRDQNAPSGFRRRHADGPRVNAEERRRSKARRFWRRYQERPGARL